MRLRSCCVSRHSGLRPPPRLRAETEDSDLPSLRAVAPIAGESPSGASRTSRSPKAVMQACRKDTLQSRTCASSRWPSRHALADRERRNGVPSSRRTAAWRRGRRQRQPDARLQVLCVNQSAATVGTLLAAEDNRIADFPPLAKPLDLVGERSRNSTAPETQERKQRPRSGEVVTQAGFEPATPASEAGGQSLPKHLITLRFLKAAPVGLSEEWRGFRGVTGDRESGGFRGKRRSAAPV